jgi:hypothetical protein
MAQPESAALAPFRISLKGFVIFSMVITPSMTSNRIHCQYKIPPVISTKDLKPLPDNGSGLFHSFLHHINPAATGKVHPADRMSNHHPEATFTIVRFQYKRSAWLGKGLLREPSTA